MEPLEFALAPLGNPLPAGLAVQVTLDGDVVAEANVGAGLAAAASSGIAPTVPDPLAAAAWAAALARARPAGPPMRASVELERALSHLAWLRSFARVLGWRALVEPCTTAIAAVLAAREQLARERSAALAALARAREAIAAPSQLCLRSRWLRLRAAGRGIVTDDDARAEGLTGPVARASGIEEDARLGDPAYERLGFAPVVRRDGDALARALVRVEEAVQSLELAAALRDEETEPLPAVVEGPRGPLQARRDDDGWKPAAPGGAEARAAAARAMTGLEWAAALLVLSSFDLSPWGVGT